MDRVCGSGHHEQMRKKQIAECECRMTMYVNAYSHRCVLMYETLSVCVKEM